MPVQFLGPAHEFNRSFSLILCSKAYGTVFDQCCSMSQAAVISEKGDSLHSPAGQALSGLDNWMPKSALWKRHEHAYKLVQSFTDTDQFYQFYEYLRQVDSEFYREYGGEILHQVLSKTEENSDSFDLRYLKLIQLFTNFDLNAANDFHLKAAAAYRLSSNSLVRYERILSSTKNAKGIFRTYQHQDKENTTYSILPMLGGWNVKTYSMQQKSEFIYSSVENAVALGKITIENAVERKIKPLTMLGDCDAAETKWLSRPNTSRAENIGCFALPSARISKVPTGIAFNLGGDWRYLNSLADIYHYFRVSGKTIFGPVSKTIERAYVLPRTGTSNYYCSLLNRLPALYAYHLLDLDLPIVSTYPLSEIEFYFAEKMGIDVGNIECCEEGDLVIEKAFVPILADLKILFARYCMSLPKAVSQFGERIYISRANATDRKMANEKELEQLLSSNGFDIVAMEKFELEEQMAIAGNAELIVAPHGAGLANMIFSKSGTSIFEFVPEYYMQSSFRQLAIDCGHNYSMQLGTRETSCITEHGTVSWVVNLEQFKTVLDDILPDAKPIDF